MSGTIVYAAPLPTLFVYNKSTKQCGTFRDGDERISYKLPTDWETYDYSKTNLKTTQQYCDELGYANIGNVVDFLDLPAIKVQIPIENSPNTNISYSLLFIIPLVVLSGIMVLAIIAKILLRNSISSKK